MLVQQSLLRHLVFVSVTKKRSTPLSFINVDISQRLQAISLPFTDCALNEATMNKANFVSSFLHLDLNDDGVEDDIQYLNP